MMEVFIAYTPQTVVGDLDETLNAWDIHGLEPVAIEINTPKKFELHRRVTAENVSKGDYILASLGTGPMEENFGELAEQFLAANPKVGMVTVDSVEPEWVSGRVAICRKSCILHWINPQGSQEADVLHANAHAQSYRNAGYEVVSCREIHYRPLRAFLPC